MGEREQPLTIQWAGIPDELAQYLSTKGWRRPAFLNVKTFLAMLSPETPIEMLPVLPHLHYGRSDILRLIRKVHDQRWVLRLWVTDTQIPLNKSPLFVGTIEVQKLIRVAGWITLARDTGEYDHPLAAIKHALNDRFKLDLLVHFVRVGPLHRDPDSLLVAQIGCRRVITGVRTQAWRRGAGR